MNSESQKEDDFAELEKALRAMRPAEPSAGLEARVFAIFEEKAEGVSEEIIAFPEAENGKIIPWFRPIAAAAAVAAVFLGGVWMFRDVVEPRSSGGETVAKAPVKIEGEYQPVSAGNVFERATNEGVVYPESGDQPMRRVRYQYHDTYEWRHPEDGSLIRLAIPHEELLYLPVETD